MGLVVNFHRILTFLSQDCGFPSIDLGSYGHPKKKTPRMEKKVVRDDSPKDYFY